jgi:hypothetical protein
MLRAFLFCLLFTVAASNLAAQEKVVRTDIIFLHLGMMQIKSNYGDLTLNYTDNAPYPHLITTSFSLADPAPMYGFEYGFAGICTRKHWTFEGINGGAYFGSKCAFGNLNSGLGYDVELNDRLNLTGVVNLGYCEYGRILGNFTHGSTSYGYIDVHGKLLPGDIEVAITHLSWYAMPKLVLRSHVIGVFDIQVTAGYRADIHSHERLRFTATSYDIIARTSTHEGIQQDGQFISGKCFNTSGLNISFGVTITLDD